MKGKLNCPVISEEKQNNSYKSQGQSEVKLQQQPKVHLLISYSLKLQISKNFLSF